MRLVAVTSGGRVRAHDGKRQALIDAATTVIARDGVAAATTRRIAEEASLPLGTVHYWFADKDALLEAVVNDILAKLSAAVTDANQPSADLDILGALRAAWKVVEDDDPGAQLAMFELTALALRTPGMEEFARKQYAMYREVAAQAIVPWLESQGRELPGGSAAASRLVAVLFDGMTLAWLADPEGSNPDQVFQLLAWLLDDRA